MLKKGVGSVVEAMKATRREAWREKMLDYLAYLLSRREAMKLIKDDLTEIDALIAKAQKEIVQ